MRIDFSAPLGEWNSGDTTWFFIALPDSANEAMRAMPNLPPDFGAIKVNATVADSTWRTSVFFDSTLDGYWLLMARQVRLSQGIKVGDVIAVSLDPLEQ